jgi:hypothetical protein
MGVRHLTIIDPDRVDTPSNLRRIAGARPGDLVSETPKSEVARRHLEAIDPTLSVTALVGDVREERYARQLLDTDVAVLTTDTHSSRNLVNQLAYQYLIPVVDIGVKVGTNARGSISGMPAELRLLTPEEGCLWCRGVLDPARLRAENLPPSEQEQLAKEGYVQGLGRPEPSLTALNHLAASIAALAALQLHTDSPAPSGSAIIDTWEQYIQPLRTPVQPDCVCHKWRLRADEAFIAFLP